MVFLDSAGCIELKGNIDAMMERERQKTGNHLSLSDVADKAGISIFMPFLVDIYNCRMTEVPQWREDAFKKLLRYLDVDPARFGLSAAVAA